jgi:hypothetical protein
MNPKAKVDLIMEIRSRILDNTHVKDISRAEEIARRWVG